MEYNNIGQVFVFFILVENNIKLKEYIKIIHIISFMYIEKTHDLIIIEIDFKNVKRTNIVNNTFNLTIKTKK